MWREENVKRSRSQEKEMPEEKDGKRKRRQRKAAETTSVSKDSHDIRKSLSGEKSVSSLWLQSCRQEGLSRFRNVRSKPDQEKVAASDKDVESKKYQGQRLPRDHAVNGCASQGGRRCSYRLSPVFIGSPSLETSVSGLPGSTCNSEVSSRTSLLISYMCLVLCKLDASIGMYAIHHQQSTLNCCWDIVCNTKLVQHHSSSLMMLIDEGCCKIHSFKFSGSTLVAGIHAKVQRNPPVY